MKNSIKMILGAFLLALVFSFAGCQNGVDADAAANSANAAARIVVTIGVDGAAARTLGPDATGLSYRLVVTDGYSTKFEEDVTGSAITKELDAGIWTVGVFAYTAEGSSVGWAEKRNVVLAEGETKSVSLVVQPLTDEEAAGTFSWTLTLPANEAEDYPSVEAVLYPSSPNSVNSSTIALNNFSSDDGEGAITGSLALPAGKYYLTISAQYPGRQIKGDDLKATYQEVVYIYPRLTTNAPVVFTAADFSAEVYFAGTAVLQYPTGASGYTPVEVELQLADDSSERAAITLSGEKYVWELSVLSNRISANNLTSAKIRFKATAAGDKSLYSAWHTVSLSDVTGAKDVELSANIFKLTASPLTGGTVTVDNPEAAGGASVRLTVTPAPNYGFDAGYISQWPLLTSVDGANGLQYDFIMPNSDQPLPAEYFKFFQLKGTVTFEGDNTLEYRPVRIQASEIDAGYGWHTIAETTTFGASASDYSWTINPANYVYTNDNPPGGERNIVFQITLESKDGLLSYVYSHEEDITSLYGNNTVDLNILINTLTGLYAIPLSDTSIQLFWDGAAWAAGGYNVYRSTDNDSFTKVNSAPIPLGTGSGPTSYTDTGLTPAYTYYYYVKGILTKNGSEEGEESHLTDWIPKTKYETPTNVRASFTGGYPLSNFVTWNAVPAGQTGATRYYDVYRDGEKIASYTSNTYCSDNNAVQFNTIYTYTVVARGDDGSESAESLPSNTVLTPPKPTDIPLNDTYSGNITDGEYQYFRVNDTQQYSYYYTYFSNTASAGAGSIYVQAGSTDNFPSASATINSGYNQQLTIYNYYTPIIVVVRGNGGSGNFSFNVSR